MKTPSYNWERTLFTTAETALSIVHEMGYEASGVEALLAADFIRRPALHRMRLEEMLEEDREYFEKLGKFVELAAELNQTVDRQG